MWGSTYFMEFMEEIPSLKMVGETSMKITLRNEVVETPEIELPSSRSGIRALISGGNLFSRHKLEGEGPKTR